MADTVEIQNVGGLRGVASEATLLDLVDAMKNGGGSTNNNSQRLQDLYNRSLNESTKEQGRLTKAFNYVSNSMVGRFAKELAFGGNRVTDFSAAIFGAGSSLTKLAAYFDDNIDTWRELSSVGASFNNSIFDMISSAANSGQDLDQFAAFIRKNSEIMKMFGGTVTLGAKRAGELGKNLRNSELGGRLFEMGFTIADINQGLMDYADLQVRLGRSETLNTKNLTQATAEYLTDLDALAKVTGKTREEFANIAVQIAADGRIRSLAARASQEGADNLTKNLASATAMLPGLGETILNISSGFIGNDNIAKALETSLGPAGIEFSNLIKNADNLSVDEFNERMAQASAGLSDYLKNLHPATLGALKTTDGVAGALASLADMGYQFEQTSMIDLEAARDEQDKRDAVTGTLAKFEQAVTDLRKTFLDFFYDFAMEEGGLFDALSGLGDVVKELISPGENGLAGVGKWIGGLFGKDGLVTEGITIFTTFLKSEDFKVFVEKLKESITSVTTWFSELFDDISDKGFWNTFKERIFDLGNWIKELFLGSTVTEMTPDGPQEVRTEGLLEKIQEYIFGNELSKPGDSLYDRFVDWVGLNSKSDESLLSQVYNKVLDAFLGKEVMVGEPDDRQLERQGGLFESMANAFTNFWEGPTGTILRNTISNFFEKLIDDLILIINKQSGGWFFGEAASNIAEEQVENETITPRAAENIASSAESLLNSDKVGRSLFGESMIPYDDVLTALGVQQKELFNRLFAENESMFTSSTMDLQRTLGALSSKAEQGTITSEESELVRSIFKILKSEGYSNGTNGFQNFGSGTMAMLHNSEAVVPRNTAAGDLLQSFYDFQNKKVATVTSTPMASDSQSSLIKKVEELNTTMIKVAELLQSSVGLQAKTVKGVKGLGSDYYRGINR